MRIKPYILLLMLLLLILVTSPPARADSEEIKEHQIKAAFIYNFLKFVDWPKEEKTNQPIMVGIIGSEDFIKAFDPVREKKIGDRSVSIKYFTGYEKLMKQRDGDDHQWDEKMARLKVCHLLMFCNCDSVRIQDSEHIVKALRNWPILTVGEKDGFLEFGGIINFVEEDEKVRFEINNDAAKKAKLTIRSKLLRLARKVIDEQASNGAKN